MQHPIEWLILAGLVLFLLIMPVLMWSSIKDLFRQEKSTGGGGIIGAMMVMDRIVNPAVQHVEEAKEVEQEEDGIGGE
ncbi:hypothetical protein [Gimesia sp.]|uniref:hypothetical protein n=1 Tax=Gimesia sp. TaxID=2024833 RepID=UPI003A8DB920